MRYERCAIIALLSVLLSFTAICLPMASSEGNAEIADGAFTVGGLRFRLVKGGEQPILPIKNGFTLRNADPVTVHCPDFYISETMVMAGHFPEFYSQTNKLQREGMPIRGDSYEVALLLNHIQTSYKLVSDGKEVPGWFGLAACEDMQRALLPDRVYKRGEQLENFDARPRRFFANRMYNEYTMPEGYSTYPFAVGPEEVRRGLVMSGPEDDNILGWPTDIDRKLVGMNPENAKDNSCANFWPLDIANSEGYMYLKFVPEVPEAK